MLDWLNDPVLGTNILIEDLIIACGIFLLGVVLSSFLPRLLAKNIARIISGFEERSLVKRFKKGSRDHKKHKGRIDKRMEATVVKPVKRGLITFYLLLFLVLAVLSLPIEMGTEFELFRRDYQAWRFIQFGVSFILIVLLSVYALEPILKATIYAAMGTKTSKTSKYRLYRSLKVAMKILIITFGAFISLEFSFTPGQLDPFNWMVDILIFSLIILAAFITAQLVVTITEPQFRSGEKSKKDTGKAIGRAIKIALYIFGLVVAMLYLGISPTTIFGGSVAAGIILGFGLQDTISNFAAGIVIVMDKPFVIGDRIRLDWGGRETWGDVTDLSLRSTWIKTPEDEMIVVPNNVIASSQVWNYTRESPKVALHFDVGISYDSDWRLAEKLMLEILHKHPLILNKPPPYILMKEFAESATVMTLWFWISEARDRLIIQSDVLKRTKDAFDRNGVEIPYPYRTQVYKTDLPKPHRLAEDYRSPIYLPSTGFRKFKIQDDSIVELETSGTVILAPTSGSYPARYAAPIVMETAKKMGASVVALFIKTPGGSNMEGQRALRIYNEVAKSMGIDIKLVYKEGDVLENILEAVETEEASIVIMGSTEESIFGRISRRSVSRELLVHLSIPTMIIPIKAVAREAEGSAAASDDEFDEEVVDFSSLGALGKMEEKGLGENTNRETK